MAELESVKTLGWSPYLGSKLGLVEVELLGRYPVRVQDFWAPAVEAMQQALRATGYEDPCDYIGSYNKRYIAGTNIWSWHSYGGAIDLDYGGDNPDSPDHPGVDRNPHIHEPIPRGFGTDPRFQITETQVEAVESIRTGNGRPVWRWLGWAIGDTMHFEPACTPGDARTGITYQGDNEMGFKDWANGMFDLFTDDEIDQLGEAGYWQGDDASYWYTLRDLGSEGRTLGQRAEVARFIQTSFVSSWLKP